MRHGGLSGVREGAVTLAPRGRSFPRGNEATPPPGLRAPAATAAGVASEVSRTSRHSSAGRRAAAYCHPAHRLPPSSAPGTHAGAEQGCAGCPAAAYCHPAQRLPPSSAPGTHAGAGQGCAGRPAAAYCHAAQRLPPSSAPGTHAGAGQGCAGRPAAANCHAAQRLPPSSAPGTHAGAGQGCACRGAHARRLAGALTRVLSRPGGPSPPRARCPESASNRQTPCFEASRTRRPDQPTLRPRVPGL
jgi:hypothetical protein